MSNYCFSISSETKDNYHIPMFDFDIDRQNKIPERRNYMKIRYELEQLQVEKELSTIFVIATENGYNAFTLDKMTLRQVLVCGVYLPSCDENFLDIGKKRGYLTLRIDHDKYMCDKISTNSFTPTRQMSNAHRIFFEGFFDLNINNIRGFDSLTKFQLIKYRSEKNGYFKEGK